MDNQGVNAAILERLEKVVQSLQDNSVKMGQLLAVHNEKLDKQDRIDAVLFEKVESLHREVNRRADEIKKGCERDIRKVDDRLGQWKRKCGLFLVLLLLYLSSSAYPGQAIIKGIFTEKQNLDKFATNHYDIFITSILMDLCRILT